MTTLLGAYILLGIFLTLEGQLRQGAAAKSTEAGEHDRSSTIFVGAAFGLSMLGMFLAPVLNVFKIGDLIPPALAWAGLVLAAGGLGLRVWAPRVLGQYY